MLKLKKPTIEEVSIYYIFNSLLVAFQFFYVYARYSYLNEKIPLWYTKPWGEAQLAEKSSIYIIPILSLCIFVIGILFSMYAKKHYMLYAKEIIRIISTGGIVFLTYSLVRIIFLASVPFEPLVNPLYLQIIGPFVAAVLLVYALTPKYIDLLREKGIVTDPMHHKHPGMVLTQPSARGGAIVILVFALLVLIFIPWTKTSIGIIVAALLATGIGMLDNIQNAIPNSKLKFLENPYIRLGLQALVVIVLGIIAGIRIDYINNPFNGQIVFTAQTIELAGYIIAPISIIVTFIWVLWIMNMLSWSNGIDGQYTGMMAIASATLAILALRTSPVTEVQIVLAVMAAILAGASLGFLPFNLHPSKVMWGFEAIAPALIFAAISIETRAKVPASMFALLIPFMDAAITFSRRIIQRKNPFKGDRGHLHHLLLERGWSVQRIATFYWITTAAFGVIAILTSDQSVPLLIFTTGGLVAFIIILLNVASLRSRKSKQEQLSLE